VIKYTTVFNFDSFDHISSRARNAHKVSDFAESTLRPCGG